MYGIGSGEGCFLVEWYQPDLTAATVDAAIDRLARAADPAHVQLLMTLTAPADETLFGVFAGDSADAVVDACVQAGWHADRITSGVQAHIAAASLPRPAQTSGDR